MREGNTNDVFGRSGQGRSNYQVNAVTLPMPQQQQQQGSALSIRITKITNSKNVWLC